MKFAFVLPFVAAADVPLTMSWEEWKNTFGMAFNGEEDASRKSVYDANVATIEAENAKGQGYTLGVNQFAHLTEDEFIAQFTCGWHGCASTDDTHMGELEVGEFADTVDWTTVDGIVNAVKDQGQCGSCWAFSAVGTVESAYALSSGELKNLAEQQVVDCSHNGGSQGCNGGFNQYAMEYIGTAGAAKQSDYPYTAKDGTCADSTVSKDLAAGVVTGYNSVTKSNDGLRSAVNTQPVSVTVKAGLSWQLYRKGVLSSQCGLLGRPNHAVMAVGYDADTFKIRNSWGASWGEAGHVRLSTADSDPFCLYKTAPFVPTLSAEVTV